MASVRIFALLLSLLWVSSCSKADDDCEATTCEALSDGKPTPLVQDLPPLPGEGPTFASVTTAGYTVVWTAAVDQVTAAATLDYRLLKATTPEEIDSLAEALALPDSSLVMDWTTATLSKAIVEADPQAAAYAVLVRDEVMNIALYPPRLFTSGGPLAGSLSFSALSESGFTVAWEAARSDVSAAENLEYRLVRAANAAAIDTVAEAEAATVILDWTKNVFSTSVSGLTANTTVAVAVLVRDESGQITLYPPQMVKTSPYRVIFKTSARYSSTHMTPSSNADALCNADSAKPSGRGTFKALIVGTDRIACTTTNCSGGTSEHSDWVMAANRTYENTGGQVLWTTNAAGIVVLSGSHVPIYSTTNEYVWTGLDAGWVSSALNCTNWTSASSGVQGRVGTANATTEATWTTSSQGCNQNSAIYCVEQ